MSSNAATADITHHHRIQLAPLGLSLASFLVITFALCVIANFLPGLEEIHFLSALYPGVDWTQPAPLIAGLAWALGTGWYVALVFGALYNLFAGARR